MSKTGFKVSHAYTDAVTLIQRFGSASSLNMRLHVLHPEGVKAQRLERVFHRAAQVLM